MMAKEKGIAVRDSAASYQQSIQRETQLRELQAEKEILEQQSRQGEGEGDWGGNGTQEAGGHQSPETEGCQRSQVLAVSEMMELCEAVEEVQVRQKASKEELIREQKVISGASLKVALHEQSIFTFCQLLSA